MKENKNKSYVLYIKGVEAFEKYKIPNVELIETKKFTDKQLANIVKGDMFLLSRQYNQKLWKMLKKIYAKQFKIASICIDSSIANLSFELFDKKQNLHTFKVHTEDSVLDFKVFKTKKEIGRGNVTPFFFVDSFTGPGSHSGRGIMHSSQYENIFNAAREFGNRYAEANGDCSELLNPEVGKKDSYNGCLKDRPGRVKYVEKEDDAKKEPVVDVNYDKNETGDNGFSWTVSVKAPDYINYEDDWNIYQNVAGEFVVRNCYRHKSLISAVNFMRPISGSVHSVIIITEEVDTDMIGAVVYTKGMKIASPWVRVDSISDVIKLMTIPLHQHIVVAKKSVWRKLKNNVSEKEQSEMQGKTEEIKKTDDADNEEVVIIYRHDGVDAASKKDARICSYRKCKKEDVTTILRKYHEGDVFNIIEKNSELHNFLLEKLESPSMELTGPSSSKNFIIYIQGELLYNTGSLSEEEKLSCKYMMHANAVDLVYLYFPIPEQFISGKIKVLTQQQDARQMHIPIKIDKGECTFKFNVGGFTEKDCSLGELADKLNDSKLKCGDNISAEIKIAHDELESTLYNRILGIIMKSSWSVSSSLTLSDKVAMIIHEVEHYKFQKDFEGDEINGLSINPRNPEITKSTFSRRMPKIWKIPSEIIVGNTYILNGNNNLGELEVIGLYVGQPVLVLQKEPSGLCLIQCCNSQKFGSIPSDNLSPFCKQDNEKPLEIIVGGKYILNGSNDIGIDAEIRPYIGKKVVVTKLHKNGLFSIMCSGLDGKVFNNIAKYNLTPLLREDNNCKSDFGATPEKSTLGKILAKNMLDGIEKLKSNSDVRDDDKRVNYTPKCSIPLADKEIASKTVEEVSEYLDSAEYDAIVNNIKRSISIKYMTEKIAGKHNIILPKDFRDRLFDLSYLPDLENRFKQFDNIGILQQELLLRSKDKDILESIGELTFAQVLELFTMLASMKGMVKVLNKDTNEWILVQQKEKLSLCNEICNTINSDANSMLEESKFDDAIDKTRIEPEKPKLTCNGIHLADIESIKIEKYGVLLIRLDVEEGYFGKDSRKCRWDLYQDIDEAVDVLRKYHGTPKVYSRLKYTSNSSKLFSNVIPEISKKSFGKIFKVLIDVDSLFYIARTWNMDAIECKKIEYLEQHNAKVTNKELHSAIEILDSDIESKYTIEPHIAIPQVEEIKTSYTMAAIKDGQYLFIDDSTFKMGEDRSATFNSILRAEGHKEEVFYALYSFEDKVRCNYYVDAANVKDKIISAVYVSSSYSDYNKNIVLREHQKADIEDIKIEKENNSKPVEDDAVKCSEAYKFKNDFAGTGSISATEPTEEMRRIIDGNPIKYRLVLENNSRRQSAKGNKTVLVIIPSADNDFDIIRKTKMELESDEKLSNYRTKFISTSSNLFVLIKNHLLSMAESDNYSLTKENISSVDKIYVPSDAIGLYYKTIKDKEKHRLAIVFSYNQENYIERVNDFIAKIHDFTKAELLVE